MDDSPWPFDQPPNSRSVTLLSILVEREPILLVCHLREDDRWLFFPGGDFTAEDGALVSLSTIVAHDPTVREVADLPPGWIARRDDAKSEWKRRPA